MAIQSNRTRYRQLMLTALFLRREHIGRNESVRFKKADGGRTIYVFDSDIIKTKCAPWVTGPRDEDGKNGYGEVFAEPAATSFQDEEQARHQWRKSAEHVATTLANYVFDLAAEPNGGCILQLPTHSAETDRVYRAVRRSFEQFERVDHRRDRLRRSYELARTIALLKERSREGGTITQSSAQLDNILDLLVYGGDQTLERTRVLKEWDNYYELETRLGGLYSVADASAFFRDEPKIARALEAARDGDRTDTEQQTFDELEALWTNRLQGNKDKKVDEDAQALASLFLINSRLKTANARCVLVTGDRSLVRQAYRRIPLRNVPAEDADIANAFSLNFVRHLWSFLSDALVDPSSEDLYSGLLARWSGARDIPREQLERLILSDGGEAEPSSESKFEVEDILLQWHDLTRKSIRRYSVEQVKAGSALRRTIWDRISTSEPHLLDLMVPTIKEDVDRVRDRTVLAMSDLGISSIIRAAKLGKRNPPELIFDSLTNTNAIFRRLSSLPGYDSVGDFELDFGRIREDCHDSSGDGDDRQESHLKFLVLAAAFASADKWMIALSHAKRAISIIERNRAPIPVRHKGENGGPRSHMSGREAYFLAATAQRLLAAGESDLSRAVRYLGLASEALAQDHAKATARGITASRFRNEDVALRLSRYYLARRSAPDDLQDPLVEALFRNAEPLLAEFTSWRSPRSASVSDVTVVSIATNLIQAFVIGEFRTVRDASPRIPCPVSRGNVRRAVEWIEELSTWRRKRPGAVIATRLIETYAWVGLLITADDESDETKLAVAALDKLLADSLHGSVTLYDGWRFQALGDFVHDWIRGGAPATRSTPGGDRG